MTAPLIEAPAAEAPSAEATTPRKPRSGGPRTQAGKDAAKRNALKHGMRAEVVLPEEMAATVADRAIKLAVELNPRTPYEDFLVNRIALASVRLERCAELETATLSRLADRALDCWDDDRRRDAEDVAANLSRNPSRTVATLRCTSHGAALLIDRWVGLRNTLTRSGTWDEGQRSLAFDLLGVPEPLRPGHPALPDDADLDTLSALVDHQIAELTARRADVLDRLDATDHERASAGVPITDDPMMANIRRWEASAHRLLCRSADELRRNQLKDISPPVPTPPPPAAPTPAPAPAEPPPAHPDPLSPLKATLASAAEPPPLSRRARKALEKQARARASRQARKSAGPPR